MPNIGPLEIIIVLVIVLLIFGPKRLPELGRSMGRGMREFKDSITGKDEESKTPEIAAAEQQPAPPVAPEPGAEAGHTQVAEPSGAPTDRT
jgi:sec-independent protein translocase protein TatA